MKRYLPQWGPKSYLVICILLESWLTIFDSVWVFSVSFKIASTGHCCHCQTLLVCLNRGTSKELKYCNNCNGRKYSDITVHLGGHECKSRCEDSSTEREIARHDIHFHPSWRGKTKTGYDLGKEAITYKRGCKYFVIYLRSRPVDPDVGS